MDVDNMICLIRHPVNMETYYGTFSIHINKWGLCVQDVLMQFIILLVSPPYKNKTGLMFFCFLQIFFHYSEFSGNVNELMLGDDVEFGIQTRNVCDRNIHVLELI